MRSLKELFIVLKDNEQHFFGGLCYTVDKLKDLNIITTGEFELLIDYIDNNRPSKQSKFYDKTMKDAMWYWPRYKWEPRLQWINYQIKKLK